MRKFDYIISGGGLAGITLAHQLLQENKKVMLYDTGENVSSRVAAGLFNPITGRKMVKTWQADLLFPFLIEFYKKIEKITGEKFLHESPVYRPFFSIEEQNDWVGKSSDESYKKFISNVYIQPQFKNQYKDPFGGIELNYSGWVNISQYLDSSIRYFRKTDLVAVVKEKLALKNLVFNEEVLYKDVRADRIIFCEGVDLKNNLFFNWLPLQLLKGEILQVELPFDTDFIFNRGIFILPLGQKKYKVGSTYVHQYASPSVTEEGRQQLEDKLRALLDTNYKVINQEAGLRPTTKDRRPFLGQHPEYRNLFILNGLGTKGVSLAPYFAYHLKEYLEKGKELIYEVNIKRFLSLYC